VDKEFFKMRLAGDSRQVCCCFVKLGIELRALCLNAMPLNHAVSTFTFSF
jgi:hypothetical protein